MTTYDTLLFEKENGIGTLTLNRPKFLNTLNKQMILDLADLLPKIEMDPEVRALIVTGAGDQAFAAGADIKEFNEGIAPEIKKNAALGSQTISHLANLPQPTIAMINGFALGGGFELALACDIRLADTSAKVGLPETGLGIIPGYGGTQRLPRLIGPGLAKELIFTGQTIDAEQALAYGIFNHVYAAGELLKETQTLAIRLAGTAPVALKIAKEVINQGLEKTLADALPLETDGITNAFETEDRVEGVNAFLEKRRPKFKGK